MDKVNYEKREELGQAYDALIRLRRDIRREVKDRIYEEARIRVKEESDALIREHDIRFANKLVAMKDAGLRRTDIAEAIRTNAHNRLQYFLNLAGADGFQRGRPAAPKPDHNRLGYEVINVKTGHIKVYSLLGKPVFPFEAELWFGIGTLKVLMPVGGEFWNDPSVKQFWDYRGTKDWKKLLDEMWDWGLELQARGMPDVYKTYDPEAPFYAERLAAREAEKARAEAGDGDEMPFG